MLYRIAVIDDFRNTFSFVQLQQYGEMRIWDACTVGGERPKFQKSEDGIWVFLNFEKIGFFKERFLAQIKLGELVGNAPFDLEGLEAYLL